MYELKDEIKDFEEITKDLLEDCWKTCEEAQKILEKPEEERTIKDKHLLFKAANDIKILKAFE